MMKVAIATFVKTPGLSPIKTRLQKAAGEELALRFYEWSVRETESKISSICASAPNLIPHWSVAEEEGLSDPRWSDWPRVYQGEGNLGDRIAKVYSELLQRFDAVILFGADSPHFEPKVMTDAIAALRAGVPFVLGRTEDGGFYLFGGSQPISHASWLAIRWSTEHAALDLVDQLVPAKILELPQMFDVDEARDLERLTQRDSRVLALLHGSQL